LLGQSGDDTSANQTLIDRLDELAVHFEAEHPSLGTALRRVLDALGKAGI
jgi:FXSXX-COOH protein